MDSELSPPCKSKFRVQIFNPHLPYFKLVSCVCYLPLCSATKICGSDPLSSALRDGFRHFLTVLIGGSLVTGAACSSGFSKVLLRAALDFEMSCLSSHRSALTSNVYPDCKKTRGSRFPLHISADARVSSLLSASCIFKVSP